jgi:hypothetical protein
VSSARHYKRNIARGSLTRRKLSRGVSEGQIYCKHGVWMEQGLKYSAMSKSHEMLHVPCDSSELIAARNGDILLLYDRRKEITK